MSLDTELFSWRPISLEELRHSLPSQNHWRQYDGDTLAYEADGWQLLVGRTEAVHPPDVPTDLRELLPAVRYRIEFILEPAGAPEEAITFMAATLAAVGQTLGCVGYDLRTGAAVTYIRRPSR
jgi:hypothetical protein